VPCISGGFNLIWHCLQDQAWIYTPFAGPESVLRYLSRYTHRIAIANSRLIHSNQRSVTFKWKDHRIKGYTHYKHMTLHTDQFIRQLLIHVLPPGFHRIRHFGLHSNKVRADGCIEAGSNPLTCSSRTRSNNARKNRPCGIHTLTGHRRVERVES